MARVARESSPAQPRDAATAALDFKSRSLRPAVFVRVAGASATPNPCPLHDGTLVIGAGTAADLIIESEKVSRTHVELTLTPQGVLVRDLGSRNGTFYQGQRVGSLTLVPPARIVLGSVDVDILPDFASLGEAETTHYRGLVGASPAMRHVFAILARIEHSLLGVLVLGESGVGKELVARALHDGSLVREGPLVVKNCGAMSRELVASELFGHQKGAFTGATDNRIGAFQAADGGTLFLDEVGELPIDVQPMLLRALESGEVVPVGATRPVHVRVRTVAATNRDLHERMREGHFREDLFFRLAVVTLTIPPLRERPGDIALLSRHFAQRAGLADLPDDVLAELVRRPYRGNARELRNVIDAYSVLGALPEASAPRGDLMGVALRELVRFDEPFSVIKDTLERRLTEAYLRELLARTGGNQSEAARVSGLERSFLRKLLTRHGLL